MAELRPRLITVDVGGTLGAGHGASMLDLLAASSPIDTPRARRILRELLHTVPAVTADVIVGVCTSLEIPISAFPHDFVPAPLCLYIGTVDALREWSRLATVVTLSNVTCVEADLPRVSRLLAPWVSAHFPSCQIGHAKPDHRAFETVADRCGVDIAEIVHIGDDWKCDVVGATRAGARAVWVSGGRPIPDLGELPGSPVTVVADLVAATNYLRDLTNRRH